jgi:hypothetical protein
MAGHFSKVDCAEIALATKIKARTKNVFKCFMVILFKFKNVLQC